MQEANETGAVTLSSSSVPSLVSTVPFDSLEPQSVMNKMQRQNYEINSDDERQTFVDTDQDDNGDTKIFVDQSGEFSSPTMLSYLMQ